MMGNVVGSCDIGRAISPPHLWASISGPLDQAGMAGTFGAEFLLTAHRKTIAWA